MVESHAPSKPNYELSFAVVLAFSVSLATLLLQLVQTRILGVVFWNHLVYLIVSIALLGFGIAGTWLSFGHSTWLARRLTFPVLALGFVASALVSSLYLPQVEIELSDIADPQGVRLRLLLVYAAAVLPYFFGGWMLGVVFRDYSERIHLLYFVDLVGAGLGCLLFLWLMLPWGAINLVALAAAVVAVPVFMRNAKSPKNLAGLAVTILLLAPVVWFHDEINLSIRPEESKPFNSDWRKLKPDNSVVHDFSEWNPISRVDVLTDAKTRSDWWVYIDGAARTGIPNVRNGTMGSILDPVMDPLEEGRLIDKTTPYVLWPHEKVMIIGAGGGSEPRLAVRGGATLVEAAEINPTTYRIARDRYSALNGGAYSLPGVSVHNEEGRSFVARSEETFDLIQITGIDTFAALHAGAYMLSENYLYTVEAIKDYLNHLEPDGMLFITRWRTRGEVLRMFTVCLEALYEMGVDNPGDHIYAYVQRRSVILVKRSPFTDAERAELDALLDHFDEAYVHWPPDSADDALMPTIPIMRAYATARAVGDHEAYLDSLDLDISPVYDDSPFFFHFDKFKHLSRVVNDTDRKDLIRGHWPSFTLYVLLIVASIAVALFMLIPLISRGHPHIRGFPLWLLYFACLGVSFIFVEIGLMQRFSLLVGHPSRSLALVLATLLVSAGIGSYLNAALRLRTEWMLAILVVGILCAAFLYPYATEALLGYPLAIRGLATVLMVIPLGAIMGMPFPTGLKLVSEWGDRAVPWMWGVNGGTTVLGSILAVMIAIEMNFTTVFVLAASGYAIAMVVLAFLRRRGVGAQTPS